MQHDAILAPFVAPEWITALQAWAAGEPLVAVLYLFGSRVKGTARESSDLDVAVLMRSPPPGPERDLTWADNVQRWRADLKARLPVKVDLQLYEPDRPSRIMGPAVEDYGIVIYHDNSIEI